MGVKARPCLRPFHPQTQPPSRPPRNDAQQVIRWVKILMLLLILHWMIGIVGNSIRWDDHGCDGVLYKAVLLGEPQALEVCRN